MPKKLTKHQRYNRKRRQDGNRYFRKVTKDEKPDGVRVTRKQITFYISNEAAERRWLRLWVSLAAPASLAMWR